MTYEDIVFDYNNRALDDRTWDTISDRERVEFVLRMVGRQKPVAWSRLDTAKSVITENEDIKRGWDLDGLPFKCLFDSPQPCPECDEKQSAIDVWEGRYADKTAECEKLKAERDELAAQVEKMLNPADVLLEIVGRIQPFALPREEDTQQKRYERLRKAYCIAQPWPIPDQACLVWRADLMHMAGDLDHKQAYFDNEKRKRDSALAADMEAK